MDVPGGVVQKPKIVDAEMMSASIFACLLSAAMARGEGWREGKGSVLQTLPFYIVAAL